MSIHQRGFVVFDPSTGHTWIDRSETTSLIVANLLLRRIAEAVPYARGKLLDVGCGNSPYRDLFATRIDDYIGVDWPHTLHAGLDISVFADNTQLPFCDQSFDTILCTEVVEHSPEPVRVVCEMARLLRPGGRLILTAPFFYWTHEQPWDYYRFTSIGFEEIARRADLDVVYVKPIGGSMAVVADIVSKLMVRYTTANLSKLFQRAFLKATDLSEQLIDSTSPELVLKPVHIQRSFTKLVALGHVMVATKPF